MVLGKAVLSSTHNLCFEQKYENCQSFFIWKFSVFGGEIFYIFVFVMSFGMPKTIATERKVCFCLRVTANGQLNAARFWIPTWNYWNINKKHLQKKEDKRRRIVHNVLQFTNIIIEILKTKFILYTRNFDIFLSKSHPTLCNAGYGDDI